MSNEKAKKVKVTILKLTVADKETVKPGQSVTLEANDAARLKHHGKAKDYEQGDEKKFAYVSPRKPGKKDDKIIPPGSGDDK